MSSFTNIIENFEEQYGVDTTRAALCLGLGLMANNEDDKADLFETVNMFQKSGIADIVSAFAFFEPEI